MKFEFYEGDKLLEEVNSPGFPTGHKLAGQSISQFPDASVKFAEEHAKEIGADLVKDSNGPVIWPKKK